MKPVQEEKSSTTEPSCSEVGSTNGVSGETSDQMPVSASEMTSKDYYFDSYAHFGKIYFANRFSSTLQLKN